MKQLIIISFIFINSFTIYSQNNWDSWDNNYYEKNVTDIIKQEILYADSVDQGLIDGKYYIRLDKYRFSAQFTGEKRILSDSVKNSMRRVYKSLGIREYVSIIDDIKYEFQFIIDNKIYWFSIQPILEKPLKKEIKKGENVYLYCLFFNEHGLKGELYNSFLISEFRK